MFYISENGIPLSSTTLIPNLEYTFVSNVMFTERFKHGYLFGKDTVEWRKWCIGARNPRIVDGVWFRDVIKTVVTAKDVKALLKFYPKLMLYRVWDSQNLFADIVRVELNP